MNEIDYFYKLNTVSNCTDRLLEKAVNSHPENDWITVMGLSGVLKITLDYFTEDQKILKMLQTFGLSANIIRLFPRTSYSWHKDHFGRQAGINMLLEGWDSITMMGNSVELGKKRFQDLIKIPYEKNRYVLINVQKWHAVYNFSGIRYILSIGVPTERATYNEILDYIKEHEL
jgi:hypothetical protein